MYADIISRNIIPCPIRFDFETRENVYSEIDHPKSHLSLGQYQNCRIPVSAPITPLHFIQFILRNFYHTVHDKYAEKLPLFSQNFEEWIFRVTFPNESGHSFQSFRL